MSRETDKDKPTVCWGNEVGKQVNNDLELEL
jgi:hypothetical protein